MVCTHVKTHMQKLRSIGILWTWDSYKLTDIKGNDDDDDDDDDDDGEWIPKLPT